MGTRWTEQGEQPLPDRISNVKVAGFAAGLASVFIGGALLSATAANPADPAPYIHCSADMDGHTTCQPSGPEACEEDQIFVHLNHLEQPSYTDQRAYCLNADDVMPDLIGLMD